MGGLDLLKRIREFDPVVPVIMLPAYGSIEGAVEAVKLGAFDYVKKPVDLEELKLLADRAREPAAEAGAVLLSPSRHSGRGARGAGRRVAGHPRGARAGAPDRRAGRDASGAPHRRDGHR